MLTHALDTMERKSRLSSKELIKGKEMKKCERRRKGERNKEITQIGHMINCYCSRTGPLTGRLEKGTFLPGPWCYTTMHYHHIITHNYKVLHTWTSWKQLHGTKMFLSCIIWNNHSGFGVYMYMSVDRFCQCDMTDSHGTLKVCSGRIVWSHWSCFSTFSNFDISDETCLKHGEG